MFKFWYFSVVFHILYAAPPSKGQCLLDSQDCLMGSAASESGAFRAKKHLPLSQQIPVDPAVSSLGRLPGLPPLPTRDSLQKICFSGMVREGAEAAVGGRAGGGLPQTPRPVVKIRVYLRTCFLTQALSQPRQTQVVFTSCFLGGLWLCNSDLVRLRFRMRDPLCGSVYPACGRRGIPFSPPPSLLAVILRPPRQCFTRVEPFIQIEQ